MSVSELQGNLIIAELSSLNEQLIALGLTLDAIRFNTNQAYYSAISRGLIPGKEGAFIQGRHPALSINIPSDVWDFGATLPKYVFSSMTDIDTVSSSDAGDSGELYVTGLSDWNFVAQTVTLDGRNKVTLPTPLNRFFGMTNVGASVLNGGIYCYVNTDTTFGVPDDNTKVRGYFNGPAGNTLMLIGSVPAGKTAEFRQATVSLAGRTAADIGWILWIQFFGGVPINGGELGTVGAGSSSIVSTGPVSGIWPEKTDFLIEATANAQNIRGSGSIDYILHDDIAV